jgi:hypothetical protein
MADAVSSQNIGVSSWGILYMDYALYCVVRNLVQSPGFDSWHYQIFWGGGGRKTVGLERVPLSLVSTTEELLRKVAAPV